MTIDIDNRKGVWLSEEYLKYRGVPNKTIYRWKERGIVKYHYKDKRITILYDTIPEPTRKRLPDKAMLLYDFKQEKEGGLQQYFFRELNEAYNAPRSGYWRNEILKAHQRFEDSQNRFGMKVNEFARKAAVFERILSIYNGKKGELEPLYKAYNQLFPGNFSMKNRFCMAVRQAKEKGVLSVAVNGSCLNRGKEIHGDEHRAVASEYLSDPKGYDTTDACELFVRDCEYNGMNVPSFKWFWTYRKNNLNIIKRGSHGKTRWEEKNGIRAKIIPALYAGDQWQIDGWKIPLWGKKWNEKGKMETFVDHILFTVVDAHSRKIIGYHIAESENTEMILKAPEMAVKETGTLPYEIVSDSHSFHKTKEAEHLKEQLLKLGCRWSVSMIPQRKAIVERSFGKLGDKHYKKINGYIGQGIRTKKETGITQPELLTKYAKPENMYTFDQIVEVAAQMITDYNDSPVKCLHSTPGERYEKSERKNAIEVNDFQHIALFFPKHGHTIRDGQITIRRKEHTFDYQLSKNYYWKYNNQKVGVRYENENYDRIYLYEPETDEPICVLNQMTAIHGALASQTPEDEKNLYKVAGRMKGIEVSYRNERERIRECSQDLPEKAKLARMGHDQRVNKLTTSKEMQDKIRNNAFLRNQLSERFGINVDSVPDLPMLNDLPNSAFKPKREKENRRPFHVGDGTMEKLTVDINN